MFPYGLFLTSVDTVVKEIEFGREQKQLFHISGEQLYYQPCLLTIDTCKVLNELKPYEVPLKEIYDDFDTEHDIEDLIKQIFGNEAEEIDYSNTYNDCLHISNHIDYKTLQIPDTEQLIIAMKANLFGDVRANYTPWMLFSIPDSDFYDLWCSIDKEIVITYNNYRISVIARLTSNEYDIEIYETNTNTYNRIYRDAESIPEIIKIIKEEIDCPDAKETEFHVIEA